MRSKPAITSFILSLIPLFFILLLFARDTIYYSSIYSGFYIVGDMLSGFTPFFLAICILSLIFGFTAFSNIKKENLKGKNFAITGIVISTAILLMIIYVIISLSAKGIPFA